MRNPGIDDAEGLELVNAMTVARLVAAAALRREESRGAHYRRDYTEPNDGQWRIDLNITRQA